MNLKSEKFLTFETGESMSVTGVGQ